MDAADAENSSLLFQAYDAEMESPNDMLVDPDEYVTEQTENEKDDVAIINPDTLDSDIEMPDKPRADDCVSTPSAASLHEGNADQVGR